jgi:hypothetical protein
MGRVELKTNVVEIEKQLSSYTETLLVPYAEPVPQANT